MSSLDTRKKQKIQKRFTLSVDNNDIHSKSSVAVLRV